MFIGHFGLAFAAKRAAPRTSLGTAFGIILLEIFFLLVDPGLLSLFLLVNGFFLLFVVIVCRLR